MATETERVAAHPTIDAVDEKIENIVDEVKAVEEESSAPRKDIGEEDSIKVEESQIVTSILAKSEEEEVGPKLESPAIEIKEDEADNKETDQIKSIPESQIPEDIKAVLKEVDNPPPIECVEQLMKDGLETVNGDAPDVETEPEEKTSADLPAEQESEEPAIAEVRDILEPADNPEISIEPPTETVESSQEQDDQPITDPLVEAGGLLADTSAEKEQDDQPSVESVIKKEEEQPGVTSAEREQGDKPSMEVVIREEEKENLNIASSEKEQDEQQPGESVLTETEEKLPLVSSEKEEEEQPSINLVIKEAEDQLTAGSVEKNPEDQPSAEPTMKEVEDQREVEQEDQPSLSANYIPSLEVECEPTMETEQPVSVLPREELEPAIVKETTSDSEATNVESEPTTTMDMEQPVLVLPGEELEAAIVKEMTHSESGSTNDENPQQEVARLDDRQTEQLQNADEVCEPQGDAAAETVKDEGILAVDAENTTLVKEGDVCKEVKEIGNSKEERVEQSESAGGYDSTPPVQESIKEEVNESSEVDIVDKLSKDVVLTDEKSEQEDKETTEKTGEENKETEGVIAQLTTVEDVGSSLSTANVTKISDEERSCQEVDLTVENKIEEDVKDENGAVTETSEVEHIEKTVNNLTTVTGETTEVNTQRSVELSTEEMADADQITKHDVENQEPSTKDGDESKSSENQQKEVPSKPAQKHSNNILSKVKQSLVKAKKAIIGKSPGSKNLPSETKGDIQVK